MTARLVVAALIPQGAAERVVRVVVGGRELEHLAELVLGLAPARESEVGDAERLANRRLLRLEPLCLLERDRRLGGHPAAQMRAALLEEVVGGAHPLIVPDGVNPGRNERSESALRSRTPGRSRACAAARTCRSSLRASTDAVRARSGGPKRATASACISVSTGSASTRCVVCPSSASVACGSTAAPRSVRAETSSARTPRGEHAGLTPAEPPAAPEALDADDRGDGDERCAEERQNPPRTAFVDDGGSRRRRHRLRSAP